MPPTQGRDDLQKDQARREPQSRPMCCHLHVHIANQACAFVMQVTTAKDDPSASTSVPQSRAPAPAMARAPAAPTFQVGDPTPGRLSQSTNRPSQAALPVAQPSPFDAIAELQQALAEPSRDPFGASQAPQHSAVDPFAPRQTMTNQAPQQQAADPFAASSLYGGPGAGYTGMSVSSFAHMLAGSPPNDSPIVDRYEDTSILPGMRG